ncbi:MAG: hypothetical protein NCW75_05205 [Phycisphaera sp.]|nr:MAG: hypothetical protein NCW75_05205 [Phycisphaera sp.]
MTKPADAIEVPADECYVAVTPKPPGRITDRVAAYAVEGQLPRPIDELCIAWRVAGAQLVVVAVDQERADRWLADGLLTARVASVPAELGINYAPIELLHRDYLPSKIRKHRHRRFAGLATVIAIGCLAIAYGLHKKTGTLQNQAGESDTATIEQARVAIPEWRESLSPQLALTGELRRLRGLASGDRDDEPIDSRDALATLFAAWPTGEGFRVESIEAAGDRLTLRSIALSRDAAISLASSLAEDGPFESGLPRVQTEPQRDGEVTRLELSLTHSEGGL